MTVEDTVSSCTNTVRSCLKFVVVAAVLGMAGETSAQSGSRPNYGNRLGTQWRHETSFLPQGVQVELNSIDPAVRKWYVPQELFAEYRWRQWQTTNYARTDFDRYVAPEIEGSYLYDMFGNAVSKGWLIYNTSQNTPEEFGNRLFKGNRFERWFSQVVVAADAKGGTYYALTTSNNLRTTLTPLVLSKVQMDGIQFDLATDKYQQTLIFSRISGPRLTFNRDDRRTNTTTFFGGRFTAAVGDFVSLGVHGVNSHQSNSKLDEAPVASLFKGRLTEDQNAVPISAIEIVFRDESPEDGTGGAAFFPGSSDIIITYESGLVNRGKDIGFEPVLEGGIPAGGRLEANGSEEIRLLYSFDDQTFVNRASGAKDEITKVEFELTVANDYDISMSSDRQLNSAGARVLLPVTQAEGNIQDLSNLRTLRFEYGLPTATQILGGSLSVSDVLGFRLYGEFDRNWNIRQYPNVSREIHRTSSGLTGEPHNDAYLINVSNQRGRWFGFAEAYSIDPQYNTTTFISREDGFIDYEAPQNKVDFVEDNDDQDRVPDAFRGDWLFPDLLIFPGWDQNGDFQPDFNQNDNEVRRNAIPDWREPFIRLWVDRPEMLWGRDMNNNFWPDLYENDKDPDYPYDKDHGGWNAYTGFRLRPGLRILGGILREQLISSDQKNHMVYGMFDYDETWPRYGRVRVYEMVKSVQDDIEDPLLQYAPETLIDLAEPQESKREMEDPLLGRDSFVNQFFIGHQLKTERILVESKLNHVLFHQRLDREERRRMGLDENEFFFGLINKAMYQREVGRVGLQPFWKSEYRKQSRGLFDAEDKETLTELFGAFAMLDVLNTTQLQVGSEFLFQKDFGDEEGDFHSQSIAFQATNWSSYLGYVITMQSGILLERRNPEGEESFTNTRAFISVFAGLENLR